MRYLNIQKAMFLSRPNRCIAKVLVDGKEETVHVKNTGRCQELLIPGCDVILYESDNPLRKTKYASALPSPTAILQAMQAASV